MSEQGAVRASQVAEFLNARLFGDDLLIEAITPIHLLSPRAFSFAIRYDDAFVEAMNRNPESLVICAPDYRGRVKATIILSDHPRLDFLRSLTEFFAPTQPSGIARSAIVDPSCEMGKGVAIGAHSVVGEGVRIGDRTVISCGVVIAGTVTLGDDCVIKSNAVIGEEGFGFAYDEFGVPMHFPHIGSIEIGNNVWIGACSTIERATIHKTIIGDDVKIDDLVQVGHNCAVGEGTLIMAGSILCGGARVGKRCWIAPNTTIKEKVTVGDEAYTGLGSVVIENVPGRVVVAGNPAKRLRERV